MENFYWILNRKRDVYKKIDDCNPGGGCKVLTEFDDKIANALSKK